MTISNILHYFSEKQKIRKGKAKCGQTVFLTFDDGPEPGITEYVLSELKKYNANAIFFCCGENIVKHKYLYEIIKASGNYIGGHTMTHLRGDRTSLIKYLHEVMSFRIQFHSSVFRPPYGSLSHIQLLILRLLGFKIVLWSLDSKDWFDKPFDIEELKDTLSKIKSSDIILLHFRKLHEERTRAILPLLLDYLDKSGYNLRYKLEDII